MASAFLLVMVHRKLRTHLAMATCSWSVAFAMKLMAGIWLVICQGAMRRWPCLAGLNMHFAMGPPVVATTLEDLTMHTHTPKLDFSRLCLGGLFYGAGF